MNAHDTTQSLTRIATDWEKVRQTQQADAIPIRRRCPSVPARLAAVIDHALIAAPVIPFQSAADLKRALLDAL